MGQQITLTSGAKLDITLPPFEISKALYQAVAEELKTLKLDPEAELDLNFLKDLFLVGIASKKIDAALKPCLERATYNGLRIDKDTFEPEEARGDYLEVCFEVARSSILPFTKSLSQRYSATFQKIKKSLEPKS